MRALTPVFALALLVAPTALAGLATLHAWAARADVAGHLVEGVASVASSANGGVVWTVAMDRAGVRIVGAATSDGHLVHDSALAMPAGTTATPTGIVATPDGGTLYVAWYQQPVSSAGFEQVVALDVATFTTMWSARYAPSVGYTFFTSLALTPDQTTLALAGTWVEQLPDGAIDVAFLGLAAATGTRLYATTWDGGAAFTDEAESALRFSADGTRMFVAGYGFAPSLLGGASGPLVVSALTRTGTPLWAANVPGGQDATRLDVAGDLVVVGTSDGRVSALDATRGTRLWTAAPPSGSTRNTPVAILGTTVVAGGTTSDAPGARDAWLAGLDLRTGALLWTRTIDGGAHQDDAAFDLAASIQAGVVVALLGTDQYVPPEATWTRTQGNLTVLAVDPATGNAAWSVAYDDPGNGWDRPADLALDALGGVAYVAGTSGHGTGFNPYQSGTIGLTILSVPVAGSAFQ